jgi:hypothetical protein
MRRAPTSCGFDEAVDLLNVAFVQGDEDGALVGKILVDRADADSRDLGDPIGRDGLKAFAFEDPDDSVEHSFDGVARPALPRLLAGNRLFPTFRFIGATVGKM